MRMSPVYRRGRFAKVFFALLVPIVICSLMSQPSNAYAIDSGKLMAGTPDQVSEVDTLAIAPAKAKIASIKSSNAGQILVKEAKVSDASGYQYKIALNKGLSLGAKSKTTNAKSFTFKNCAQGYKYYAKVRAYKVVNGKKVYGPWSDAKSITVKAGKTAAVCKSRMFGKWEMVSGTGVSADTVKQAKAKGLTYIAIVKSNKLYIYQVLNGKRTLQANGSYTLNVKTKTKAIGKKSGYYDLTINVNKSKLSVKEKSKTLNFKRL